MAILFFDYQGKGERPESGDLVFLSGWDDAKWARLLRWSELRRFEAGESVVLEGDTDRSLFVVIDGTLEVVFPRGRSGKARPTEVFEPGTVLGEQAFLDAQPRSASLHAVTGGQLLCLSVDAFDVFAAHEPELAREFLRDLARTLSVRLREANAFIREIVR